MDWVAYYVLWAYDGVQWTLRRHQFFVVVTGVAPDIRVNHELLKRAWPRYGEVLASALRELAQYRLPGQDLVVDVAQSCDVFQQTDPEGFRLLEARRKERLVATVPWAELRRGLRIAAGVAARGRPRGSGTFANKDDFVQTLRSVVAALRAEGKDPTEQAVVDYLASDTNIPGDERQLRRWTKQYGFAGWEDLISYVT